MSTGSLKFTNHRTSILLIVIGLYLVLNYGFMQVRVPPTADGGIPIGEMLLFFGIVTSSPSRSLKPLTRMLFLLPFISWWVLGIGRALFSIPDYGLWALRDATHVIESLFLLVGFDMAKDVSQLQRFFRWLPRVLLIGCIYTLGYPFQETLRLFSPTLTAGSGNIVPIFFTYTASYILLLAGACTLLMSPSDTSDKQTRQKGFRFPRRLGIFVALFLLCWAIFLFQARMIYVQMLAIIILMAWLQRQLFQKTVLLVMLFIGLVAVISNIGLSVEGRLGESFDLSFLMNHILSIGGVESPGLEGAATGVGQRLDWWSDLLANWTSSWQNMLFGLGYGFPLIDFQLGGSVAVREPHNSYVSILARLGLLGGLCFVGMHWQMLRQWFRTYRLCQTLRWQEGQNQLLQLMIFFVLVLVLCIGEDGFEKPFIAIPYYFFWGIALRWGYHLKNGTIGPMAEPPGHKENPYER